MLLCLYISLKPYLFTQKFVGRNLQRQKGRESKQWKGYNGKEKQQIDSQPAVRDVILIPKEEYKLMVDRLKFLSESEYSNVAVKSQNKIKFNTNKL